MNQPRLNVAIVRENPDDHLLLQGILLESKSPVYEIRECQGLASAISLFQTFTPDVVFIDLQLIDTDSQVSRDWCRNLTSKTAVILLSGLPEIDTVQQTLALGVQDFLVVDDLDARNVRRTVLYAIERARSNEKMRLANERYRLAIKATRELIWDWDLKSNQVYRDEQAVSDVFGIRAARDIEDHSDWQRKIHPDDAIRLLRKFSAIRNDPRLEVFEVEYRILGDDQKYRHIYDRGHVMRNQQGEAIRVVGAAQNVTEKRLLEQALKGAELKTRRAVARATIRGQENERKHLGLELHDNITQILATATLFIDHAISGKEVRAMMIKSRELITFSTQELRKLSHQLLPPSDGFGLKCSLEKLTSDLATTGLVFHKNWEEFDATLLTPDHQLAIFRIVQEQLNNVLKHALASHIEIKLISSTNGKQVKLEINDNGLGFDLAQKRKGVGLRNIITRADLFNGRVSIKTKPGAGCRVKVLFPIHTDTPIPLRPAAITRKITRHILDSKNEIFPERVA